MTVPTGKPRGNGRYKARMDLLKAARDVAGSAKSEGRVDRDLALVPMSYILKLKDAIVDVEKAEDKNRTSWGAVY